MLKPSASSIAFPNPIAAPISDEKPLKKSQMLQQTLNVSPIKSKSQILKSSFSVAPRVSRVERMDNKLNKDLVGMSDEKLIRKELNKVDE